MTTSPRFWVLDLDDTLYAERDYVRSALAYVGVYVEQRFGSQNFARMLLTLDAAGKSDPIADAWKTCALPETERETAILAMRAHSPNIKLSEGAHLILSRLRQNGRPYAIVTDGRSITQRAKIAALGCGDARAISISEEMGISKLDPDRFRAVADAFPPGHFCYVGDNPKKDFAAPKRIGWDTIMLDHRGEGIHSQDLPDDPAFHPSRIVGDLRDLLHDL